MAYDLNQLTEALRSSAAAKGQVESLTPQVATAQALRGTPADYENPWAALGGMFDRMRGREEMTALQPQLAKARGDIAAGENAAALYNAQRQADQTTYDRSRAAAGDLTAAEAVDESKRRFALTQALAKRKQKFTEGKRDDIKMQNLYTGEISSGAVGADGTFYIDGSPVSHDEWAAYEAPKAAGSRSVNAAGFRAPTASQQTDIEEGGRAAHKIFKMSGNFSDEFANPAGGTPFAGDISNYLAAEAPILTTEAAEDRQKWWSDFKQMYELVERHGLFGAALTKPEIAQWRQATVTPNMSPKQIRAKLKTLEGITRNKMQSVANSGVTKGWNPRWLEQNTGVKLTDDGSGTIPTVDPTVQLRDEATAEQEGAIDWLESNPNDPRAQAIRERLESEGVL
jgi:hypothetical protein